MTRATPASKRPTLQRRTRKPLMKAQEQYILDFGQNVGPVKCETCGMLYAPGEEKDEKAHARYHASFDEGIKWTGKTERPKKYMEDGSRIISIRAEDPKAIIELATKVLKSSESDLSAGDDVTPLINKPETIFLLYITESNHIVGYLYAETIKESRCLIDFDKSKIEPDPIPSDCGVQYLWVHPSYRRQGIATWLVDVARANLFRKRIIPRSRVAVCDPTDVGVKFFAKYLLNRRPVRVYHQE